MEAGGREEWVCQCGNFNDGCGGGGEDVTRVVVAGCRPWRVGGSHTVIPSALFYPGVAISFQFSLCYILC